MTRKQLIGILLAIGICAYFSSLFNGFVWDDEQFIQKNVYITSLSYLPQIFTTNTIAGAGEVSNYYRPLTTLSFALDYQIWGLNPFGFHLTNTILHLSAGMILFLLLLELGFGEGLAFWISVIFLVHPLQTEAVTYANSRGDSFSALLLFASLYLFTKALKHGKTRTYIFSALLFISSILAKEVSLATAPLFLVLMFWMNKFPKKGLVSLAGIAGLTAGYAGLRLTVLNFSNSLNFYNGHSLYTDNLGVRLLTFCKVLWIYLGLIIFPYPLHMERTTDIITNPLSPWVLGALAFAGVILGLGIFQWKKQKKPWILLGAAWFTLTILPSSGIIPINGILYEHWLYTPMIGLYIIGAGVWKLFIPSRITDKLFIPLCYLIGILTIICLILTIHQNYIWSNPITFYEYTLQYANSARLHNNLAMAYADQHQNDKAISEYQKGLEFGDTYPEIHHNLGNIYTDMGKYDLAEKEYLRALQLDPQFFFTYPKLVNLYLLSKQEQKAIPYIEKIIVENPNNPQILLIYGKVLFDTGKKDQAEVQFNKVLQLTNNDPQVIQLITQIKSGK